MRLAEPVDPGLQQERTALAWRRTGLALVIGGLTIGRLAMDEFGSIVLVPLLLVGACAGWVVATTLRARRFAATSGNDETFRHVMRDGRLPAVVAGVVLLMCAAELATAVGGLLRSL